MPIKRRTTTPRRRKSAKRLATLRAEKRKATKTQAAIDKRIAAQAALAAKLASAPAPLCQHPRTRARGGCARPAIVDNDDQPIMFEIPADYMPATRHALQPSLPRPLSRLCVQHRFLIDAF